MHTQKRGLNDQSSVLLATCQAQICDLNENKLTVRILLDQGSELSFITENIIQRLNLKRNHASIPLLGIGGLKSGKTRGVVELNIKAIHDKSIIRSIKVFILPRLTGQIPTFNVNTDFLNYIHHLQLADPDFNQPGSIDMIIGADSYHKIILPEIIPATSGFPLAQLTIFGWVFSGPVTPCTSSFISPILHCSVDNELEKLLVRFWTQEEPPLIATSSLSPEEQECDEHYQLTHSRDSQGRYIVRLPIKKSISSLED